MSKTQSVPHLGGITVSYRLAKPVKQSKPSLVLLSGLVSSVDSYETQLNDESLSEKVNVIAVDPLGNGATNAKATDTWTYWDSAIAVLQLLDTLNIRKAFVFGPSSAGWVAVRMALYSPDVILGLVLAGTSLDSEVERSYKLGNADSSGDIDSLIQLASAPSDDFAPPSTFSDTLFQQSVGDSVDSQIKDTWSQSIQKVYTGEAGRKRFRQTFINLRDRDTLHSRLADVKCPVIWLQGDKDAKFSVQNAQEEIKLFTGSSDAKVEVVSGGANFLHVTNRDVVSKTLSEFVNKYSDKPDARKLREAIGMVDI